MTSLIFGSIYMGHKAFTQHRREKSRVKNYERWEGLRDEYDAQRKISRESRSLDLQRTGPWDQPGAFQSDTQLAGPEFQQRYGSAYEDKPILTLRDQQEANDARTSWRPQESWDGHQAHMTGQQPVGHGYPHGYISQRHVSMPATNSSSMLPLQTGNDLLPVQSQPTGGVWDTPIPAPLRVSRRSFEDYDQRDGTTGGTRAESLSGSRSPSQSRHSSRPHTPAGRGSLDGGDRRTSMGMGLHGSSHLRDSSSRRGDETQTADLAQWSTLPQQEQQTNPNNPFTSAYYETRNKTPAYGFADSGVATGSDPVQHNVPGGRMAELLEGLSLSAQPTSYQAPQQQQQQQQMMPSMTAGGRMAELIERGY